MREDPGRRSARDPGHRPVGPSPRQRAPCCPARPPSPDHNGPPCPPGLARHLPLALLLCLVPGPGLGHGVMVEAVTEPPGPSSPGPQGDLLLLLDSSSSVSYYEFSRMKEFLGELVRPLPLGPTAVRAGLVHIATQPASEFPLDGHRSGAAAQQAIRAARQRMGDTNAGRALAFAREQLLDGARPHVPKVLLWVTDGGSTDPVAQPAQDLKAQGATVFIVSTGRGNYLELASAASPPPDRHLHFVDVDDLPSVTRRLRDHILEAMWPQQLHATEITSSSFRLVWPPLLSDASDYYVLEVTPDADATARQSWQLPAHDTTRFLGDLQPATTYRVTLVPESNLHYLPPQTVLVTTLDEEVSPAQIHISNSTSQGFRVGWAPTPAGVLKYQLLYGPLPASGAQVLEVPGTQNSTVLENLAPNTTYLVTVVATYRSGKEKALSAKACTQEVSSSVRDLRLESVGLGRLKASWDPASGAVRGYRVRCRRQAGPWLSQSVSPWVRSVLLADPNLGARSRVCVTPIYGSLKGRGRCRDVRTWLATEAPGYRPG
ncbi:von Willebrand factor A domain-containing protein 1 [Tachyglossus aculeatus]|uniref:von Willebrand factor A domain-containing protein 1 n=1 Tax=Tachyglossus aculeatus TaxID=9261 RepID=UPI0018F45B73|nr:von Willebrand factor A domain-containing protein 1 [Tachyglossus aculeatus]XP_038602640.1 von Willebrand factor A domain-containing protein 1 [Tachyglossus aculeatus]